MRTITRMHPEHSMLSETSQTLHKYCMLPLTGGPRDRESQRQEGEWRLPGAAGGETGTYCSMGTELQFGRSRRFWSWTGVVYSTVNVLHAPELSV